MPEIIRSNPHPEGTPVTGLYAHEELKGEWRRPGYAPMDVPITIGATLTITKEWYKKHGPLKGFVLWDEINPDEHPELYCMKIQGKITQKEEQC